MGDEGEVRAGGVTLCGDESAGLALWVVGVCAGFAGEVAGGEGGEWFWEAAGFAGFHGRGMKQ